MVECGPEFRDAEEAETARLRASLRTTHAGGLEPLPQDMDERNHSGQGPPAAVRGDLYETRTAMVVSFFRVVSDWIHENGRFPICYRGQPEHSFACKWKILTHDPGLLPENLRLEFRELYDQFKCDTLADRIDTHQGLLVKRDVGRNTQQNRLGWRVCAKIRFKTYGVHARLLALEQKCRYGVKVQEAVDIDRLERDFKRLVRWIDKNKKSPSKRCQPKLRALLLRLKRLSEWASSHRGADANHDNTHH